jgi:hypothetical protein
MLMRKILWIVPMILLIGLGCTDESADVTNAPGGGDDAAPDIVLEEGGILTKFYDNDHPRTAGTLQRLMVSGDVLNELQRFETQGYAYDSRLSFVAEGTSIDGRELDMSVLCMSNTVSPADDEAYLLCFEMNGALTVVPALVSYKADQPEPDWVDIGDGVLLRVLKPWHMGGGLEPTAAGFSWKKYAACIGMKALGGGAGCAFRCRWAGIGYLKCLGACTGAVAIYAMISCAFAQAT